VAAEPGPVAALREADPLRHRDLRRRRAYEDCEREGSEKSAHRGHIGNRRGNPKALRGRPFSAAS
jgi:hypothetical protein